MLNLHSILLQKYPVEKVKIKELEQRLTYHLINENLCEYVFDKMIWQKRCFGADCGKVN